MKTWTKPHHGVTHYGEPIDGYWATVIDWEKFAELSKWFPGCGFSPIHETYDTVSEAKAAGELWANQNGKR